MSEATIMAGLQTAIQAMEEFKNADVVINDWDVLSQTGAKSRAPFVIIESSDDFESRQDVQTPETTWNIKVTLIEGFGKRWKTTLDNLQTRRQAIIDKINDDDIRSAGGLDATTIDTITAGSPITEIWNKYELEVSEAVPPDWLAQLLILECLEF